MFMGFLIPSWQLTSSCGLGVRANFPSGPFSSSRFPISSSKAKPAMTSACTTSVLLNDHKQADRKTPQGKTPLQWKTYLFFEKSFFVSWRWIYWPRQTNRRFTVSTCDGYTAHIWSSSTPNAFRLHRNQQQGAACYVQQTRLVMCAKVQTPHDSALQVDFRQVAVKAAIVVY